jgi:hypothetical protein
MRPARPLKAQEYLRFTSGLVARRSDFDQEYLRRRGFSDLSRLAQAHAAKIRGELIDWIETAGKSCSNAGYPASIII